MINIIIAILVKNENTFILLLIWQFSGYLQNVIINKKNQ